MRLEIILITRSEDIDGAKVKEKSVKALPSRFLTQYICNPQMISAESSRLKEERSMRVVLIQLKIFEREGGACATGS